MKKETLIRGEQRKVKGSEIKGRGKKTTISNPILSGNHPLGFEACQGENAEGHKKNL